MIVHGTPLVGRERELATLTERLEAAERGEGGVVLIAGEPGIGKTRLLTEFGRRAGVSGWLVLTGRAYDTEGVPPYLPFVEALKQHSGASPGDGFLRELAERSANAPVAHDQAPGSLALQTAPSAGPEAARYQLFEATSQTFLEIAADSESRGLLLCLDDLHWADRPSLLLLQHLARRLGKAPLLIVATYREAEVDETHALYAVVAQLRRERLQETLSLSGLSLDECAALIDSLAAGPVDAGVGRAICERTEGNPFFVEEVVRRLQSEGRDFADKSLADADWGIPEGLRQVIGLGLSRLSAPTRGMLQTAAVLGAAFPFDLLAEASGLESGQLTDSVEEAEQAGMLRPEGEGYAFGHALMREMIYDDLSLPRRRQLHAHAAQAMESRNNISSAFGPEAIGHHWRQAGKPAQALLHLLRAGDAAISLAAWEDATRHWEAALECMAQADEPPKRQARLLEGLGDLYFLSGFDTQSCVERYMRASALYDSAGDRIGSARSRIRAGATIAYPAVAVANYPAALAHLRAAEKVLSLEPESFLLGELYAAIAHIEAHVLASRPEELLDAMHRLSEIAERLNNDFLRVFVFSLDGHYLGHQGRLAEGMALEARACEETAKLEGKAMNQWPERWHEFLLAYAADDAGSSEDAGAYQLSRPFGHALMENWTALCCGLQSLELHDPVRARVWHERVRDGRGRYLIPFLSEDLLFAGDLDSLRDLAAAGAFATGIADVWARKALVWAEGRWTEMREESNESIQRFHTTGSAEFLMYANRRLLRFHRVMRDAGSAESVARECLDVATSFASVKFEFGARAELALLLAESGRLAKAEPELARCREILAEGEDWRGLAGRFLLAEAVYAAGRGDSEQAASHFDRAIEVFQKLSLPWDEAEAFEVWARSCRRFYRGRSRRSFVAGKLSFARGIYERIGAGQPWLDRLQAEETRLSGDAETAPELPDGLSEREVDVLRLVAAGRSNPQIAGDLVISLNTVQRHVSNIFNKIGVRNRTEAAGYARDRNLI